ncbi:XkdX family protein [Fructobacillus americanaquae]
MLKGLYPQYVDKEFVQSCVKYEYITPEQYKELTNEEYEE